MNILNLITTLVGVIGTLGGLGTFLYYRQNKTSATADAIERLLTNAKTMSEFTNAQAENFIKLIGQKDSTITSMDSLIQSKTLLISSNEKSIFDLGREISLCKQTLYKQERQILGQEKKIEEMEYIKKELTLLRDRVGYSEHNICLVGDCELRRPKRGKYKGGDEATVAERTLENTEEILDKQKQ